MRTIQKLLTLLLFLFATSAQADSGLFPNSYSVYLNAGHFYRGINAPAIPGVSNSNVTRGLELESSNGSFAQYDRFHDGTGEQAWLTLIGHRVTLVEHGDTKLTLGGGVYATRQSYLSFKYDRKYPTYGLFPTAGLEFDHRVRFDVTYFPKSLSYNLGGSLVYAEVSLRLFTF